MNPHDRGDLEKVLARIGFSISLSYSKYCEKKTANYIRALYRFWV